MSRKVLEAWRRHAAELKAWNPSNYSDWLTEEFHWEEIQPRLSGITVPAISSALGLSVPYAGGIRAGRQRQHPRHWLALSRLVSVSQKGDSIEHES